MGDIPQNSLSNVVRIAVAGCGLWTQTRHLPQLVRMVDVVIVGLIEPNDNPYAAAVELLDTVSLSNKYNAPMFKSVDEFFAANISFDGMIVCSSHESHYDIGCRLIERKKNVLMEKPMTTNVQHAQHLVKLTNASDKYFQVNHTANWRKQSQFAKQLIASGEIGEIRHITCSLMSPLRHLFENERNTGWIRLANGDRSGFAWGQLSHSVAWVLMVTDLVPKSVYCTMGYSDVTNADIYDSAIITCANANESGSEAVISISGVGVVCGAVSVNASGKLIENKVFGTKGMLFYNGQDNDSASGCLTVGKHPSFNDSNANSNVQYFQEQGFQFENTAEHDIPESLQSFVDSCHGKEYFSGCSAELGCRVVKVIDAMYRSATDGKLIVL